MNDNDIIKALGCCRIGKRENDCKKCPLYGRVPACVGYLTQDALALINRLKAEIERLTGYNENLQTANTALSNEIIDIRNATIKEFEEKLKSHKRRMCGNDNGGLYWDQAVLVDDIDRVLKEMTEDNNA
jgi:hypothetical protein